MDGDVDDSRRGLFHLLFHRLTIKFSSQRGKTSQKGSVWKGTLELPTFRLKLPLEIFEDDSKQDK